MKDRSQMAPPATWNFDDPMDRAFSNIGDMESRKANQAARDYMLMGANRSLRNLLAAYVANSITAVSKSWATISDWSQRYDWVDRARRWDDIQNQRAIEAYEAPWRKKIMSATEVLGRLSEMARASVLPFVRITEDGAVYFNFSDPQAKDYLYLIRKVKTKRARRLEGRGEDSEEWEDEWVEVELHDAQNALVNMGRHHKLFVDQQEVSGTIEHKGNPEDGKRFDLALSELAKALGDIVSQPGSGENSALDAGQQSPVAGTAIEG
jgi:hypothetical protein